MFVRDCKEEDLEQITNIYNYYVLNSPCTMDYVPYTLQHFKEKFQSIKNTNYDSFIVAENSEGKITGYAYSSPHRAKIGYHYVRELTIYINKDFLKQKIGQLLLDELEKKSDEYGHRHLIATIESSNVQSIAFFEKNKYFLTSTQPNIAFKFDKWCSIVMYQKTLSLLPPSPSLSLSV